MAPDPQAASAQRMLAVSISDLSDHFICFALHSTVGKCSATSVTPSMPTRVAWASLRRVSKGWLNEPRVCCLTAPSPVAISVHHPHAGYKFMGINRGEHEGKAGLWYREWAPGAKVRVFGALQCVAVVPCNNPANRLD